VYMHLGLFEDADVTSTDVSFNKCVGKDNMHYIGQRLTDIYGKQGSCVVLGPILNTLYETQVCCG
jgi:hypothetical protein